MHLQPLPDASKEKRPGRSSRIRLAVELFLVGLVLTSVFWKYMVPRGESALPEGMEREIQPGEWDYELTVTWESSLGDELKRAGDAGWQLVTAVPAFRDRHDDSKVTEFKLLFKRPQAAGRNAKAPNFIGDWRFDNLDQKLARTPEEAVQRLEAACRAEDFDRAMELIAHPQHDPILVLGLIHEAEELIWHACQAKFGRVIGRGITMPTNTRFELLMIGAIDIKEKKEAGKGRFRLRVWEDSREGLQELEYLAVKVGNGWKLLRPPFLFSMNAKTEEVEIANGRTKCLRRVVMEKPAEEMNSKMIEWILKIAGTKTTAEAVAMARKDREMARKIVAAIKEGKYTSRAEAYQAFMDSGPLYYRLFPQAKQERFPERGKEDK